MINKEQMSVNAGLGAMCAVEGIVHLVNLLYPVMSPDSPDHGELTTEKCDEIFPAFRRAHLKRLQHIYDVSAQAVRFEAQRTFLSRIMARYVLPWCSNAARLLLLKGIFGGQPMFNHLPKDTSKAINRIPA